MGLVHARNVYERVGCAELVLVMDSDAVRARSAGESFGVRCSTEYEELLADPGVEAVVLATPTGLHAEMIESAARAGKHVFVEKPLAFEMGDATRAIAAARAAHVYLQVGFQRRHDRDWFAVRERLAQGAIGTPRLLRIAHRNRAVIREVVPESLGDVLVDLAIHDFDTARWLLGEIAEVRTISSSRAGDGEAPRPRSETVVITARFHSGALGIIDNTRAAAYGFECSGEVLGSDGALRVGAGGHPREVEWLTAGEARVAQPHDHVSRHADAYVAELEQFARAVLGQRLPEPTGDDGAAALAIVEAARASLAEGRAVRLAAADAGLGPPSAQRVA
jgi:predicted dehydrogenase